jgi:hypothetical protein
MLMSKTGDLGLQFLRFFYGLSAVTPAFRYYLPSGACF